MKKLCSLVLALVMICGLMLTGCAGSDSSQILKMGLSSIEGVFNPIVSDQVYDTYVCDAIFEPLTDVDREGEFVPVLADWTLSEDKLTYTFTLKDGIKFSDGEPLTADDVYFTYMRMGAPDYVGPRSYAVSSLKGYEEYTTGASDTFEGIQKIDDKTIAFTFADGNASPANIGNFVYGILPEHIYNVGSWEDFIALNEKPVGSGIMKFDSWAPNEFVKLVKNENYWDKANAAKISGVLMSNVPEESIISALQTNQIDFAQPNAAKENVEAIEAMENVNFQSYLGNGYTFMCFNCTRPQLSDVRVRQALMYALDRKSFIDLQYGSSELATVGMAPISPTSWAYPDPSTMNDYAFDLEKAASLMDEAGWAMGDDGYRYKDGEKFSVTWLVYTDSPWPGTLSSMAADTWKQLGVDLKIELMDFNTVSARTMDAEPADKDFDIYTMGFSLDVDPDPTGALFDDNAYVAGGFNASGYKNEEAMALVAAGRAEFDTAKRADIYKEWATLMNHEIPHVIVAYRAEIWGVNKRVSGLELGTYYDWVDCLKDITLTK